MRKLTPNGPGLRAARPSSISASTGGCSITPPTIPTPPAWATASASGGVATPPIPASCSGTEQPTRVVKRVRSVALLDLDDELARHALEAGHAVRDVVEALLVDRENDHLGRAEHARIVERPDL